MTRGEKTAINVIIAYVVIGLLVFGHFYNRDISADCYIAPDKTDADCEFNKRNPDLNILRGMFWLPVGVGYSVGKVAIWVTRWP